MKIVGLEGPSGQQVQLEPERGARFVGQDVTREVLADLSSASRG